MLTKSPSNSLKNAILSVLIGLIWIQAVALSFGLLAHLTPPLGSNAPGALSGVAYVAANFSISLLVFLPLTFAAAWSLRRFITERHLQHGLLATLIPALLFSGLDESVTDLNMPVYKIVYSYLNLIVLQLALLPLAVWILSFKKPAA